MAHWLELWWLIVWRCGGLLIGDVVGYWLEMWRVTGWRCGGLLVGVGDMEGYWLEMRRVAVWRCGGLLVGYVVMSMCWLLGRCGGSLVDVMAHWSAAFPASYPTVSIQFGIIFYI